MQSWHAQIWIHSLPPMTCIGKVVCLDSNIAYRCLYLCNCEQSNCHPGFVSLHMSVWMQIWCTFASIFPHWLFSLVGMVTLYTYVCISTTGTRPTVMPGFHCLCVNANLVCVWINSFQILVGHCQSEVVGMVMKHTHVYMYSHNWHMSNCQAGAGSITTVFGECKHGAHMDP